MVLLSASFLALLEEVEIEGTTAVVAETFAIAEESAPVCFTLDPVACSLSRFRASTAILT